MATAGSIVVDLLMKTGSFETDADRAGKKAQQLGKNIAAGAAAAVAGAGAAVTAVASWTREIAALSFEVDKMSRLAGTDSQTFQRWAAGAASVGIEQDKLADILKDTQDKVGDFLQTGGGPMKDFFEKIAPKVGITAEQFRKLSGPEALGAYVSALEKSGLSQSEMVFYMEAIASDSTQLLPLLRDNARGMKDWGDQAEAFGAILDAQTNGAMKEFREQSNRMELMARGFKVEIAEGLTPALKDLNAELNSEEAQQGLGAMIRLLGDMTREATEATAAIVRLAGRYTSWLKNNGFMPTVAGDSVEAMKAERERLQSILNSWRMNFFPDSTTDKVRERIAEIDRLIKAAPWSDVTSRVLEPEVALPRVTGTGTGTTKGKSDAEKSAERLGDAFRSANDQLERQIALYGDTSELSRVNYEIQSGALKGIDADMQAVVRSSASYLDILKSMDEVDAYQAEDAQKLADAFSSMFGIDGDSSTAAEAYFGRMSTFAEQAARNIQTYLGDSMFNILDGKFSDIGDSFVDMLKRMTAELAASQMLKMLGEGLSGYSGKGAGWINALGGLIQGQGGRAGGGPVAGDSIYRVGEGGRPELFQQGGKSYLIPGDAGSVRPITASLPSSAPLQGHGGQVRIEWTNNGQQQEVQSAQAQSMPDGSMLIKVVTAEVKKDVARGGFDAVMGQSFGLKRQGASRG